jgi:hypothetical protein
MKIATPDLFRQTLINSSKRHEPTSSENAGQTTYPQVRQLQSKIRAVLRRDGVGGEGEYVLGMVKAPRTVTCIFCGRQKSASEEDVIPKWIRRTLDPTSEIVIRAEPTGATSRMQHLVVMLADMVCEECNNTWMSKLENRGVKPFLEPMLTNKHRVTIGETEQRDLARWAIMKVLLMEHAMRQRRAHLRSTIGYTPTDPELAWLYSNDEPPPRSRVWLGAFDARGKVMLTTQARLLTSAPTPSGDHTVPAHMTTLTIGYVMLQVFSTNFVLADAQAVPAYGANPPQPYAQALSRIWPIEHSRVQWPPSAYVSPETFDDIANWGQPTT